MGEQNRGLGAPGVAVQLVEGRAALRHRTFFSLAELLGRLDERPFHKLPGSRRSVCAVHPSFDATEVIADHCESCSP